MLSRNAAFFGSPLTARAVEVLALLGPHVAEIILRLGKVWFEFKTLVEMRFRLRPVAMALARRAQFEIKRRRKTLGFARLGGDFGGREMAHGFGEILLP